MYIYLVIMLDHKELMTKDVHLPGSYVGPQRVSDKDVHLSGYYVGP